MKQMQWMSWLGWMLLIMAAQSVYAEPQRDCPDCPEMAAIPGKNFEMGKYEVTQAEWEALMGLNPSYFKGANLPVEQVNWIDVQEYLKRLNRKTRKTYRLPTEAEWEFACLGGTQSEYCGSDDIGAVAWYRDNSDRKTHPVGQKQANGYGLHDMSGNVFELTSDCLKAACDKRMVRGGSFDGRPEQDRAAGRYIYYGPLLKSNSVGFRLARTLP